jgi:sulfate adenylyltransferase
VNRRGVCVWLTGLSGAGKSTIARILAGRLERRGRPVTLLDGDVVRTHLSKGLGFSKDDRDTNIRRIGFVASEVVRHGGAVICAVVSPYESTREEARRQIGEDAFVLVHVATPLEECERRDVKGLYAKARRGEITGMTGIDDPYEPPSSPDIVLDTMDCDAERCADRVEQLLDLKGWL